MIRSLILLLVGATIASTTGWILTPKLLYKDATQPVAFSHKVHADKAGVGCPDCHMLRADGSFSGIPTTAKCGECHSAPMGDTKAEAAFVKDYVTPNREVAWLSYAQEPDNAWFPHAPHLNRAKLACARCHGGQGASDTPPLYQVNRISGYSRDVMGRPGKTGMRMDDCVRCHHEHGLKHACLDCHK
jgi:hypothetical protein